MFEYKKLSKIDGIVMSWLVEVFAIYIYIYIYIYRERERERALPPYEVMVSL